MNLVFCGTPQFAVPVLEKLIEAGYTIPLVLTQPDRPRGRGMEVAFSPVKECALKHGLTIQQPEKIKKNEDLMQTLQSISPDVIVVVGYGRIIPKWMLDLPRFGNINLHGSLLPKYRGAAPIQWAIASGESVTGVTTMLLNEGLDTGDILLQASEPIADDDTSLTLAPRLAKIGAELMQKTLEGLQAGTIKRIPQDDSKASLAPILEREDAQISFACTAQQIYERMRGFTPWPGAYTTFRGKKLIVHAAKPSAEALNLSPAQLGVQPGRLFVGCAKYTVLELFEVQLEGKKRLAAREFLAGYKLESQEALGQPSSV